VLKWISRTKTATFAISHTCRSLVFVRDVWGMKFNPIQSNSIQFNPEQPAIEKHTHTHTHTQFCERSFVKVKAGRVRGQHRDKIEGSTSKAMHCTPTKPELGNPIYTCWPACAFGALHDAFRCESGFLRCDFMQRLGGMKAMRYRPGSPSSSLSTTMASLRCVRYGTVQYSTVPATCLDRIY